MFHEETPTKLYNIVTHLKWFTYNSVTDWRLEALSECLPLTSRVSLATKLLD